MSGKIIKPEGNELLNYLNEGYAICNHCGAVMDYTEENGRSYYVCPSCDVKVDSSDYEYDNGQDKEWTPQMIDIFGNDIPPTGCMNRGGPYPYCKLSCKLFDD